MGLQPKVRCGPSNNFTNKVEGITNFDRRLIALRVMLAGDILKS